MTSAQVDCGQEPLLIRSESSHDEPQLDEEELNDYIDFDSIAEMKQSRSRPSPAPAVTPRKTKNKAAYSAPHKDAHREEITDDACCLRDDKAIPSGNAEHESACVPKTPKKKSGWLACDGRVWRIGDTTPPSAKLWRNV
ncbi:hypothetical protein LTR37_015656 [Vermiconidia calcicola]|uniref:Uncharacterized protein n=1 Tax=Vermiconidia calcicola TaxID=1690605 RepID=A0ACC3MQT9_9PEZI|nr:hypothetical protein LTR37_015656 [Vermiconidia calcicola]